MPYGFLSSPNTAALTTSNAAMFAALVKLGNLNAQEMINLAIALNAGPLQQGTTNTN